MRQQRSNICQNSLLSPYPLVLFPRLSEQSMYVHKYLYWSLELISWGNYDVISPEALIDWILSLSLKIENIKHGFLFLLLSPPVSVLWEISQHLWFQTLPLLSYFFPDLEQYNGLHPLEEYNLHSFCHNLWTYKALSCRNSLWHLTLLSYAPFVKTLFSFTPMAYVSSYLILSPWLFIL